MKRDLQQILDFAEECLSKASMATGADYTASPVHPVAAAYWQQLSLAASQLATAVALASAVKYDGITPPETDA